MISGSLGYFGLNDWWFTAFNDSEREYIKETYNPLTFSIDGSTQGSPLTDGNITSTSETRAGLLGALGGWFKKRPEDRDLANRIIQKAVECGIEDDDVVGLHFSYQALIKLHYRWRNEFPDALDCAINACQKQIALAPRAAKYLNIDNGDNQLSHVGFEQYAIILDKQGRYQEAIDICRQAERQGWMGGWQQRINRYKKKLTKRKN